MTAEELLERYAAGERDFQNITIRGMGNLSGATLIKVNMSSARLCCNLRGADLSGSNLSGADLSGSNLSGADLSGSNLRKATMASQMRGVNLRDACLIEADIAEVDLSGAILRDADLSGCTLGQSCLEGVDLTRSNLQDAYMGEAFGRADLSSANLVDVRELCMPEAIFCETIMPDGTVEPLSTGQKA